MNIKRIENHIYVISTMTGEEVKTLEKQNQNVLKDDKGNAVYAVGFSTGKLANNMAMFNHITDSGKAAISMEIHAPQGELQQATESFVANHATAIDALTTNEGGFKARAAAIVAKNAEILAGIEVVAID